MPKEPFSLVEHSRWRFDAAGITNVGKVRQINEDNLYFNGIILPQDHKNTIIEGKPFVDSACPLFAVFDGMGGYAAGERASFLAANTAKQLFDNETDQNESMLLRVCRDANKTVCDEMESTRKRIGTTASMLYFSGDKYSICNIGDSPVLLYRDGSVLYLDSIIRCYIEKTYLPL